MDGKATIQLKANTILNVPLNTYDSDFLFLVNGEEYKTSRIKSDLLSPIICQYHQNDPTMDTFKIDTNYPGHFSYIFDLLDFKPVSIPNDEIPFILEVLKIINNDSIDHSNLKFSSKNHTDLLKIYEKYSEIFSTEISEEIATIAQNFYNFCDD